MILNIKSLSVMQQVVFFVNECLSDCCSSVRVMGLRTSGVEGVLVVVCGVTVLIHVAQPTLKLSG